jgi:2-polyprenyl-3-methyl-5-hydroxy-6-metoxy-1,4-benzoquinol methylase
MNIKEKKWEVWDQNRAEGLIKGWGDPRLCIKEINLGSGEKHWGLIKTIYSLIEGKSVLDVGCGLGHLFVLLKNINYLGIDSSKSMLTKARIFFPKDKDRFKFGSVYDLSALPLFDTVIANGLILHLPKSESAITQLWSRTKTCLIFTAWLGKTPLIKTDKLFYQATPDGRYLIRRRETINNLKKIFNRLPGVCQIKKYHFNNSVPGSNIIFKLLRR